MGFYSNIVIYINILIIWTHYLDALVYCLMKIMQTDFYIHTIVNFCTVSLINNISYNVHFEISVRHHSVVD